MIEIAKQLLEENKEVFERLKLHDEGKIKISTEAVERHLNTQ